MRVTETQIKKLIHQSNLIEGYDSSEYDAQGLVAWRKLMDLDFRSLSHHDIHKTQKIITLLQDDLMPHERGYYRWHNVQVGDRLAVQWQMVPHMMENWLLDYQTADPIQHHVAFEKIHPFPDGNGRTGRMLMWWMQLKLDQPLTEILDKNKQEYYSWFR